MLQNPGGQAELITKLSKMVSVAQNKLANVVCHTKFEDENLVWFNPTVRVTIKYHVVSRHEEDQLFELMIPRLQGICENDDPPHTEEELALDAKEMGIEDDSSEISS